ncbi:MAG TPA: sigma-70 family RNA polymerase sigma factor [Candidatus Paceibacterota bacterium]|nr:sigma-70 family RNA polymerase sigma factor [Candidatus Paceibacterota bacterium]
MDEKPDSQLLREYAEHRSEAAFRELVYRYTDLVYSAALRQVIPADAARDVAQEVFTDLAAKAKDIAGKSAGETSLAGWLFRSTRFLALNHLRDERRRLVRERQVMEQTDLTPAAEPEWERIRPILDEAMSDLTESDRDALLLRFFKNRDFRTIGESLGLSDDAAQKRVSRALEKLRAEFVRRGVTTTAVALTTVLSANAVTVAPTGLAITLSTSVLAGAITVSAATATKTTLTAMNWINFKSIVAIATSAVIAGTGTYVLQQREVKRLRDENQSMALVQQQITDARAALSASTANNDELERLRQERSELLRLRGEVGTLRAQTKELEKLRESNRQLQDFLSRSRQSQPAERDSEPVSDRQTAMAKMSDAKMLVLGLIMYSSDNKDQLPADLSQTTNYWNNAEQHLNAASRFELVIRGSMTNITNPSATIAVREKETSLVDGKRVKVYGFADGHSELKTEPSEGFDAWEQQHMIPQPIQ